MARMIRLKDGRTIRWPEDKDLKEVIQKLSSDEIMGSSVLHPEAPLVDQIKYKLCGKIVEYQRLNRISQKALAELLNVDEPEMSRILHYKIERYSIDRLIGYLEFLYPKLRFEVDAA